MAEATRLLPPKGKESFPVFLASGQSIRIFCDDPDGKEGSIVPPKYRRLALAAGCIEVGTEYEEDELAQADGPVAMILRAIETIVNRDVLEELEGDGRPKLGVIKSEVGFNATRAQVIEAWKLFEESLA
ncbi:hypothetical protein QN399_16005 [Pseudomonas sp. 10C3]|uniref:hypothetical protein n=1 Tax=Pseudomonas sp. 10C3 TaxID=3118753 RepID=UPI002E80E664|nr:hypothetical protein [Pseudomonas sp. 10C3]MEE3507741.1 hypothetical protein [Pseudomonas sp. 10C3]